MSRCVNNREIKMTAEYTLQNWEQAERTPQGLALKHLAQLLTPDP